VSHLKETAWHGYATEPRRVTLTIESALTAAQITSAELRITNQPPVALTPEDATGGYLLTADLVTLPEAANYYWSAEVTDADGNTPIVVAIGTLHVDERVPVAAPLAVASNGNGAVESA
jgi:hypothetical protein